MRSDDAVLCGKIKPFHLARMRFSRQSTFVLKKIITAEIQFGTLICNPCHYMQTLSRQHCAIHVGAMISKGW